MLFRSNPFEDSLFIECEISREDGSSYFDYVPTVSETQMIKEMIAERIKQEHNQTPQEFCEKYYAEPTIGGIE